MIRWFYVALHLLVEALAARRNSAITIATQPESRQAPRLIASPGRIGYHVAARSTPRMLIEQPRLGTYITPNHLRANQSGGPRHSRPALLNPRGHVMSGARTHGSLTSADFPGLATLLHALDAFAPGGFHQRQFRLEGIEFVV